MSSSAMNSSGMNSSGMNSSGMNTSGMHTPQKRKRLGMGILQRYVLKEFLAALVFSTLVFTAFFVFMISLSFEREAARYGTNVVTMLSTLPYLMPYLLCFSVPMSFLVAAVLTFGKLEGEGEIEAMRASGVQLTSIFWPPLMVALLTGLPFMFLVDTGINWGFSNARIKIVESGRVSMLERLGRGKTFNIKSNGSSYRIHRFAAQNDTAPLAIVEFKNGAPCEVILARDHTFDVEAANDDNQSSVDKLIFTLASNESLPALVRIFTPGESVTAYRGEFEIETDSISKRRKKFASRPFEEGLTINQEKFELVKKELLTATEETRPQLQRQYLRLDMEINRKYSFILAPLALMLIGIPLGLRAAKGGRVTGFVIGIAVIMIFYHPIWFAGQGLALSGQLPAVISVWAANALAAVVGIGWIAKVK